MIGHAPEDALEAYSMNRLQGSERREIKEHLLLCERCRLQLSDTGTYIRAMRAGAALRRPGRVSRTAHPNRV
jgi:hypothetical protein